jgi:hypothetical protein
MSASTSIIVIIFQQSINDKAQQKKPFFSCCSTEEERKEAIVEVVEKRPVLQLQPKSTVNHIVYQPVRVSALAPTIPVQQIQPQTN